MKRYLYLWHRWLGIGLGVFVVLWILSGMVMLFVGYPKLTPAEHLSRLAPLAADCCVGPAQALRAGDPSRSPLSLQLTSAGGSPRYLLDYGDGPLLAIDASNGQRIERIGPAEALASAYRFADTPVRFIDRVEEDAWTRNGALNRDRPLYRVQSADAEDRLLYVSSQTGLVVRDATAHERAWNRLGAWLHWLYPLRELMPKAAWAVALIYGALLAALLTVLGLVIGLMRWRLRSVYRDGSHSPYPPGAGRLHHSGGLAVGLVLLVWLVSGALSMEPWGLFQSRSAVVASELQGASLHTAALGDDLAADLGRLQRAGLAPVELHWRMLAGQVVLSGVDAHGESRVLAGDGDASAQEILAPAVLEAAVRRAWPGERLAFDWLQHEDFHYYRRAEPSLYSQLPRRLPVVRVRFDDPAATWLHIDPYSGAVIEQLDTRRRAVRWMFKLLHSWDWPPLLGHAVWRDGLLLVFSAGALLIAGSGVCLGWRRLRWQRTRSASRAARLRKARTA
ncbi:PepSY domain-containing protein [Stutzerimonas stutzeri]|uniref:PepSY domain-containing protein n=1 Tax=Stutzerimonas stutzeri TaxID=316 RepID=UPI0002E824AE|nr:PepSY domain-containing protein [Stutzerimonas stutzeri]